MRKTREYVSKHIQDSYAEMLLRFAIAAEYKDDEIGRHIIRVSDYSVAIGKELNISSKKLHILRFASIMHDIGKIGVANELLHKKGITNEEFATIKEHTTIGSRIFTGSTSPLLKAAGEIALCHHEWYDGTGYPAHLKGNKIPLFARIVALADFFDAVTSERSYKKFETFDRAVEMVQERSGSQFDPGIAESFIKCLPEIRDIFNASKTINSFLKDNVKLLGKINI